MGLRRRSLAAILALGLAAAWAPAAPWAAAQIRPLAGVRTWVVYYGAAPEAAADLARFDVVVLDPHAHPPLLAVKQHGSLVLMYVSLGEVNTHHPEFADVAAEPWVLAPNPNWPEARRLDVRAPAYERWLLDRVVPRALMAAGVNGLFLDTADTALQLERAEPAQFRGAGAALERVLDEMRRRNPRAILLLNGGLPLVERRPRAVDAVAVESVWTDYDFKSQAYRARPREDADARAAELRRVADLGVTVFTLDYVASSDRAAEPIRLARARGFIPYVSTIGLDRVSTYTLMP